MNALTPARFDGDIRAAQSAIIADARHLERTCVNPLLFEISDIAIALSNMPAAEACDVLSDRLSALHDQYERFTAYPNTPEFADMVRAGLQARHFINLETTLMGWRQLLVDAAENMRRAAA